jgi:F-type H+-transporting ATPase subunit b
MLVTHRHWISAATAAIALAVAGVALASGDGGHAMDVDEELGKVFVHAVNFVLFIGLLVYFLRRPLKDFLASRRLSISSQLDESERLKSEARTRFDELDARFAAFDQEIADMLATVKTECELERDKAIANANDGAEMLLAAAERGVTKELEKARHSLRAETVDLAMTLAEDVLRGSLAAADHGRLATDYFDRIAEDVES